VPPNRAAPVRSLRTAVGGKRGERGSPSGAGVDDWTKTEPSLAQSSFV
jgi:hypothetical protein